MIYVAGKLEFSPDPLSDTTPAWVDITRFCMAAQWSSGKAKDLDSPQAGAAEFVLKNIGRMFEPEYTLGAFYPNIVPLRRFRFSLTPQGGASSSEGVYYATSYQISYPLGTDYSFVTVQCVDGFGLLSLDTLASMDPANAESLADVIAADEPAAFYLLAEGRGAKLAAETGPEGTYNGARLMARDAIVAGARDTSVSFGAATAGARAKIDDVGWFSDPNAFTIEAVVKGSTGNALIAALAWKASANAFIGALSTQGATAETNGASLATSGGTLDGGDGAVHHVATTFDAVGGLRHYVDGVLNSTDPLAVGRQLQTEDANEFLYVGGLTHGALVPGVVGVQVSHVAFYGAALSPARIAAHAAAAVGHGYFAQDAGARVAAIVANPLWSTAAIPASPIIVEPRFQTGQAKLDEAVTTAEAEAPFGYLFFNDAGNPQYVPWQTGTLVPAAVFGDGPGEIGYQGLELVYDDEIYNQVQVSREGGDLETASDATSQDAYKVRSLQRTDLILDSGEDAFMVASDLLARFQQPAFRVATLTLNGGSSPAALTQILAREIGDVIRVRRLSSSGHPIDVITTILGKAKAFNPDGDLTCTWNLARGFNAAVHVWRLGVTGFDELGSNTILA